MGDLEQCGNVEEGNENRGKGGRGVMQFSNSDCGGGLRFSLVSWVLTAESRRVISHANLDYLIAVSGCN